jgi:ADP-heptose:LPS heptosyltransferase
METASLVASADLVITVDTMIAHLAGALGKPTWLLLKADPDWRWSLGRTSPWYPSMRLYRQPLAGDWGAVIAEVQRDLATRPRGITHRRAEAGG